MSPQNRPLAKCRHKNKPKERGTRKEQRARTPLARRPHLLSFSASLACAPLSFFFFSQPPDSAPAHLRPRHARTHTASAGLSSKRKDPRLSARAPIAVPTSANSEKTNRDKKTGHSRTAQRKGRTPRGQKAETNRQEKKRTRQRLLLLSPFFFIVVAVVSKKNSESERWDKVPRQTCDDNNTSSNSPFSSSRRDLNGNGDAAAACSVFWWANCVPIRRRLRAWPCWTRWRRR